MTSSVTSLHTAKHCLIYIIQVCVCVCVCARMRKYFHVCGYAAIQCETAFEPHPSALRISTHHAWGSKWGMGPPVSRRGRQITTKWPKRATDVFELYVI